MTSNLYLLFNTPIRVCASLTVISTAVFVSMRSLFQAAQHRGTPEPFLDTPPSYEHISGALDAIYHCPWADDIIGCFKTGLKKNPIIRPLSCSVTENNLIDIVNCSLELDQKIVEKVKVTAFLILLGAIWYTTLPTGHQNKEKAHP
ncbi:MAG TPA: hypothetical protein VLE95_01070 [Chlamydiales bacterium]|nr:hypothetical protein [Chlamydiales bacterium]